MKLAPVPPEEAKRLESLRGYAILDTAAEKAFDDITKLAAEVCETPVALLSFVDSERQWFKSNVGLPVTELRRDVSFCAHAILETGLMEVKDARADERFADNPAVVNAPNVRFYAGMPLVTQDGYGLGTLCVVDWKPRELTEAQREKMKALAASAMMLLEMRRAGRGR